VRATKGRKIVEQVRRSFVMEEKGRGENAYPYLGKWGECTGKVDQSTSGGDHTGVERFTGASGNKILRFEREKQEGVLHKKKKN